MKVERVTHEAIDGRSDAMFRFGRITAILRGLAVLRESLGADA